MVRRQRLHYRVQLGLQRLENGLGIASGEGKRTTAYLE